MRRFFLRPWACGLSLLAILIFSVPFSALSAAPAGDPTTEMKHKPMEYFVPGHRIQVSADISDDNGVRLARCYFKTTEEADIIFVVLKETKGAYTGIIPAPSENTLLIEYLFLVVNESNVVVKSQTFQMKRSDDDDVPAWQQKSAEGEVNVYSELAQAPEQPPGFTDAIHQDVVESSLRFGVVAGLYPGAEAVSGSAATATSAGTVTATSGMSGLAIAAIAGGVLVAGGAAAAVAIDNNQSDDESDSGGGSSSPSSPSSAPYSGTYNFTIQSYTFSDPEYRLLSNTGTFTLRATPSNSPTGEYQFSKSGACAGFASSSTFQDNRISFSGQYNNWECNNDPCCSNNMTIEMTFSDQNSGNFSASDQSCCSSVTLVISGTFKR